MVDQALADPPADAPAAGREPMALSADQLAEILWLNEFQRAGSSDTTEEDVVDEIFAYWEGN
jgi:hypothetical protein